MGREDDWVTKWIRDKWREPHADDPDPWFAMVFTRFVNWHDTLREIGYPVSTFFRSWQRGSALARSSMGRVHDPGRTFDYARTPEYQVELSSTR